MSTMTTTTPTTLAMALLLMTTSPLGVTACTSKYHHSLQEAAKQGDDMAVFALLLRGADVNLQVGFIKEREKERQRERETERKRERNIPRKMSEQ